MIKRTLFFVYGIASYAIFFATFLYAIGFVANVGVPKSIDSAPAAPLWTALLTDGALLAVFALQHSGMARQGFKRAWTKIVPPPVERSTYVLLASAALLLLFWKWQPVGGVIWEVHGSPARMALKSVGLAGWMFVLASTFLIDHFDLFGLRQVFLHLRGTPYRPPQFTARGWYRYVRHPIYLGFIIAFWATPHMSAGHLLFAAVTTAYIFVGIALEERDLIATFGDDYRRYRQRVAMLVPFLTKPGEAPRAAPR